MRYLSPLRYPGGKAKLTNFVQRLMETNSLLDGEYVEPYAGGASIALNLLVGEFVSRIHINDLDRSVYAFWHSVLNETEALCKMIWDRRVSRAEWHRQKAVQRRPGQVDLLELGFSTFFLNRTNRSGIIQSAGMIGGVNQTGDWKIDARYNKQALVERIKTVAKFRNRIVLHNDDAAVLVSRLAATLPKKALLYLDPPYYVKGKRRLYANSYKPEDHAAVAALIGGTSRPWIVSYDDASQIRRLYKGFRARSYTLGYSASEVQEGAEVMFFSPDLRVPRGSMAQTRKALQVRA